MNFLSNAASPAPSVAVRSNADGVFEGYASLFGAEDQSRDVVMPGAFRASLVRRGVHSIRMLFQHDPAQPIGAWEIIREDARGLYVRGCLIEGVARAREILALIKENALDGYPSASAPARPCAILAPASAVFTKSICGRSPSSPFPCCPARA